VFLVLATRGQPMVGISGALFGLVGALLAWSWEDATGLRARLRAIAPDLAILLLLGLGAHVLLAGQIAWQTHLGGFLGGWVLGIALDRPRPGSAGASS
jgi:membrane associated rhomboid family serine protease